MLKLSAVMPGFLPSDCISMENEGNITCLCGINTCSREKEIKNIIDIKLGYLDCNQWLHRWFFPPKYITEQQKEKLPHWWTGKRVGSEAIAFANLVNSEYFRGYRLILGNVFCMPETDIYLAQKMSLKRDQWGAISWWLEFRIWRMLEIKSSTARKWRSQKINKCPLVLLGINKYLWQAFPLHGTTPAPVIGKGQGSSLGGWRVIQAQPFVFWWRLWAWPKCYHGLSDKRCELLTTE